MTLQEYYIDLKSREKDFPAELCQGYEAIIWDIERILKQEGAEL